jgi:hypothetical protein
LVKAGNMLLIEEAKELAVHADETCPNMDQIKKLKGEIKRLRQDLIMKGSSNKRGKSPID